MARLFTLGRFELLEEGTATDSTAAVALPTQPKRLALLTYLAVAGTGAFHRRDTLLGVFWPELGPEEARRALRQALHHLRRYVGESSLVTRSDDQVGLRAESLWCDAVKLDQALREGRDRDALALYRGPFLDGVHLADVSSEFEEWASGERVRLAAGVVHSAWRVADREAKEGNHVAALEAAGRGHLLAPADEAGVQRLLRLAKFGDRATALMLFERFERRLADDFGVEPSSATKAMVEELRTAPPIGISPATPIAPPAAAITQTRPTRLNRTIMAAAATLAIGIASVARFAFGDGATAPVLAVGWIDNQAGDSSESTVTAMRGLLATDLARVEGLSVISQSRMLEILAQLGRTEDAPGALGTVARRGGATELLEGTLYRRAGGLRLELRRVELASGVVRGVYVAEEPDPYALVERLTVQLAEAFGNRAPTEPLASSGTGSMAARALYEQGLRSYYRGEWRHAYDHLRAAVTKDSTFAIAAYYAARAAEPIIPIEIRHPLLELAERHSANAPLRDRLTIRLSGINGHHASLALAESMVTRYPNEPSGLVALAHYRTNAGDWLAAIPIARRAASMDSLSFQGRSEVCRACEAYELMIGSYHHLDSLVTAERIARDYVRLRPASPRAWSTLVASLTLLRREKEAFEALNRIAELMPDSAFLERVKVTLRFDHHQAAERLLRDRLDRVPDDGDALWWLAMVLRHQGRLLEALGVIERLRRLEPAVPAVAWLRAQVLFEQRKFLEAAAIFDSTAHSVLDDHVSFAGLKERYLTWTHTHAATAWIAAGDTARVSKLADTIAAVAPQSAYGRDWRLPNHIHGLLSMARGDHQKAAAQFRNAVYSVSFGYSRTNLELALALLRSGRPAEAIPVLQAALRGPNESSGVYATRPEFHELLGRAFQEVARRDSAAAHYRFVLDYWSGGDPAFRARADTARARLRAVSQ